MQKNYIMNFVRKYMDDGFTKLLNSFSQYSVNRAGYHVTAEDVVRGCAEFETGLSVINGHMVQIYRAGHIVTADAIVSIGKKGVLIVESGARSYLVLQGDIIAWIVW